MPLSQAVLNLAAPTTELQRRGWFSSLIKAVVKVVTVVFKVVVAVVAPVVKAVVSAVVAIAQVVVNVAVAVAKVSVALAINAIKLVEFAVTGQYSNSLTLPINIGPPSAVMVDSPWGQAFKMYTFKVGEDDEKFDATKTILDNMAGDLLGEADPEPGFELPKPVVVLAYHEITDGDVSVKEAGFLPQRLVPFNAVSQRSE